MGMSFAHPALVVGWVVGAASGLDPKVYGVPSEIDREVARLKLEAMGVRIDELTPRQQEYLASWTHGT